MNVGTIATAGAKKKPSALFFIAVFAAIAVMMLIVHLRSSLEEELYFPLNNGVAELLTCGNTLAAISHDRKIYVWDWNNLAKQPRIHTVESSQAALLGQDIVASVAKSEPQSLVLRNLQQSDDSRQMRVLPGYEQAFLAADRTGNMCALVMTKSSVNKPDCLDIVVCTASAEANSVLPVVSATAESVKLKDLDVSEDAAFVALVGEKNAKGWIMLVDVKARRVVWEQEISGFRRFHNAVFSSDGKVIYARGSDSTVYVIDSVSGKVLSWLLAVSENVDTLNIQSAQMVVISPNGQWLAATVLGTVYVWDIKTGKIACSTSPPHKVISSIVFSSDSRCLATSDMRQGGTIMVWRISKR